MRKLRMPKEKRLWGPRSPRAKRRSIVGRRREEEMIDYLDYRLNILEEDGFKVAVTHDDMYLFSTKTYPSRDEAIEVAKSLVDKRLRSVA
jgi:hypothetical protein